jgi:hypothetical protein
MGAVFKKGCCWVCGAPLSGAGTRCCSRERRARMADFEEFAELRFILLNSRCFGGAGFRTFEEKMQEAVRQLSISADLLAQLLIELHEIQDQEAFGYET